MSCDLQNKMLVEVSPRLCPLLLTSAGFNATPPLSFYIDSAPKVRYTYMCTVTKLIHFPSECVSCMFVSLYGQSINDSVVITLSPPRFPPTMLQNAHIQVFYSG